jgi:thioredoxin reductase (NADPH)
VNQRLDKGAQHPSVASIQVRKAKERAVSPEQDVRNVIIVGSGPAGYTAAIYAARAQLKPVLIEGVQSGGALMTTTEVENFPGFPDGVNGPELMESMRKQAERFGAELITDDVTSLELGGPVKVVRSGFGEHRARAVILATGSAWRPLGVPGEQELLGHGVSSCATCDGFFFRDQHVVVVGGGDSAMEEATFLTRFAASVTIIHRRDEFRASKIMQERAFADPKITVRWNSVVEEVLGSGGSVTGVRLRDVTTSEESRLDVTGVFIAIGHDPRSILFRDQVATDSDGYVTVESPSSRTSLPGVFACGDLVDHTYRQAITAAGTGCVAALDVERYLAHASQD